MATDSFLDLVEASARNQDEAVLAQALQDYPNVHDALSATLQVELPKGLVGTWRGHPYIEFDDIKITWQKTSDGKFQFALLSIRSKDDWELKPFSSTWSFLDALRERRKPRCPFSGKDCFRDLCGFTFCKRGKL